MIRLLVVVGSLDLGGTERHLFKVLPRLVTAGFDVAVFTLMRPGVLAPQLSNMGIVVNPHIPHSETGPESKSKKLLLLVRNIYLLWRLMLTWRPMIAHFYLPQAYLIGGIVSLFARIPCRLMSRRSLNVYQNKHRFMARIERMLHSSMDAVIGNSRAVSNQLYSEGVTAEKIHLIYNGIDPNVSLNENPQFIRRSLGVSERSLVIIVVANLIPYKGHADLLEAMGLVRTSLPSDWSLILVGRDDGIGGYLKELAKDLNIFEHVLFLGARDDAQSLFRAADIGVLCSHEEGFSNAILEGMAAGLPMIVTDVGGNAEAIDNKVCGYVVAPKNPYELSVAIQELADNPELRKKLGGAASVRVQQKFHLDQCVKQYIDLYHKVMSEKCPKLGD